MFELKTDMHPTGFPPVAETLPAAVEKIARELNPEKIILFGSYAYGNPTPDSDVDLLVVMETSSTQRERYRTVSLLLYPPQFPIDIIVKTPMEIVQELKTNFFLREIVNKGKVLYDKSR